MPNLLDLNTLPSQLQNLIQDQFLVRALEENIIGNLAWDQVAEKRQFTGNIGGSMTMTRVGLLPIDLTERSSTPSSDLNNGMIPVSPYDEQFNITCKKYSGLAQTNLTGTAIQSVGNEFMINASRQAEKAARSKDVLARNAFLDPYTGGHTRVRATMGSAGPVVTVDDARGFNPGDTVVVGSNTYTVASVALDASNVSTLSFPDSGQLGKSGSITFTSNVTVNDGTAGNAVDNVTAAIVMRAGARATTAALQAGDTLTLDLLLDAKTELEANGVPKIDGAYNLYTSTRGMRKLWNDPMFQNIYRGGYNSPEYRDGEIHDKLGIRFIESTNAPVQTLSGKAVHRSCLVGGGALIEAQFTSTAYGNNDSHRSTLGHIEIVNDIAFITSMANDALNEWVKQAYAFYSGFVAPTDKMLTPAVMPSANNAIYKRGVTIEHTQV